MSEEKNIQAVMLSHKDVLKLLLKTDVLVNALEEIKCIVERALHEWEFGDDESEVDDGR